MFLTRSLQGRPLTFYGPRAQRERRVRKLGVKDSRVRERTLPQPRSPVRRWCQKILEGPVLRPQGVL